jgi:hypothetical protein
MRTSRWFFGGGLVLATLALAACDPATLAATGGGTSRAKVTVAGRAVTVAAPSGLCIDSPSTIIDEDGAFFLISDCGLISGNPRAVSGGALTAAVSSGGLGGEGDDQAATLDDLEAFLGTPDGLAILGRSGQSGAVRQLTSLRRGDVLYVLVEDRGRQPVAGIDRRFWRAFLEVNGRMTVLSVLGFEDSGVDDQQSLNQLAALAASIRAANPARG